jgi:putative transposase
MKKRFTEEQIISVLKEAEAGAKVADLSRKYGIAEATFYNWKAKFGGMTVSEAQRLKELESENAKLKRLLAEAMLDNAALKDVVSRSVQRLRIQPARHFLRAAAGRHAGGQAFGGRTQRHGYHAAYCLPAAALHRGPTAASSNRDLGGPLQAHAEIRRTTVRSCWWRTPLSVKR